MESPPLRHGRKGSLDYLRSSLKEFIIETVGNNKDSASLQLSNSPEGLEAAANLLVDSFLQQQFSSLRVRSSEKKGTGRNKKVDHHQTHPIVPSDVMIDQPNESSANRRVQLDLSKHIRSSDQRRVETA